MTAARALAFLVALAGCDPVWTAELRLRDPANRPVPGATVAVACRDPAPYVRRDMAARSDLAGAAQVGGLGALFPPGCDLYVAKPGYLTRRIRYADLCPEGPEPCRRVFRFELVLAPAPR